MTAAARSSATTPKQALRLQRFVLALAAYSASIVLLAIAHELGLIALVPAASAAAAMLAVNAVVFVLYRTGLNERFADPSLTWLQITAGMVVLMYVVYHFDRDRSLALLVCLLVLSFGTFRFNTREFLTAAGVALAGYAAVINLLFWLKPDVVNVVFEAFQWTTLAFVLPCFAVIGGRVSEMRARLVRTNAELTDALEMIQRMATHDTLTGLPNRALFNETLGHAIAQAARHHRSAAIFFLDLDRFKFINDTLGHAVGDRVLEEAARRLRAAVRDSDVVARLGGDEFVLLLEDFREEKDLADVAQKVLAAFEPIFTFEETELALSASLGICIYPAGGADVQTLVANADIAMYRAKELGRNRFCFYAPELNNLTQERLSLEAALRHALPRGEFEIYYQPKVDFGNGHVTGVEALLRWHHPELGMLLPDRFIPLAEEIGVIVPVGLWVLNRVCERARRWEEIGMPIAVAVNLSAVQFHQSDLVGELTMILRTTGLSPALLELEITETLVMKDPDRAGEVMRELRAMGVRITMDDFGTGYSSLSYLKRFPVDRLKVDQSFVRELPHNSEDVAITRAVIALAHSLKMTVVAEGVEHQDQYDLLRKEGCDEFQGHFCRPPMDEHELMRFLTVERARYNRFALRGQIVIEELPQLRAS